MIAPLADRLSNNGNAGITYQFAANAMVGASGTFTNLHYPDPTEVPGLYDAASRGGSAFYSYRVAQQHYLGVTYQYQELLSYPTAGTNETQTDGASCFSTLSIPRARFSFSLFGGPQYYSAGLQFTGAIPPIVAGCAILVAGGRRQLELAGAAHQHGSQLSRTASAAAADWLGRSKLDSANASVRQQITRNFSASLAGGYANNGVLSVASLWAGIRFPAAQPCSGRSASI